MELKGSQTEKNLWHAFAGESQAHTKYQYYASQAKKDGYVQIQNIFLETAKNEKEHAKLWFKALHDGGIPDTLTNLADAAAGENEEWTEMYAEFVEKEHEERYRKLIERINAGEVFKRGDVCVWKCNNCGHIHIGKEAPEVCPVCAHGREHFELRAENY